MKISSLHSEASWVNGNNVSLQDMTEAELTAARDAVAYGGIKYADLSHTRTQVSFHLLSFFSMLDFLLKLGSGKPALSGIYLITIRTTSSHTIECSTTRETLPSIYSMLTPEYG